MKCRVQFFALLYVRVDAREREHEFKQIFVRGGVIDKKTSHCEEKRQTAVSALRLVMMWKLPHFVIAITSPSPGERLSAVPPSSSLLSPAL